MCLIFMGLNAHPRYKLVVAANRDEFYQRKTAPLHQWDDHPEIIGGRDMEAFGTWMGMNRNGKLSMVTNFRDPANINPVAPSRGKLVTDFLLGQVPAGDYMNNLAPAGKTYNGFNLIAGTADELFYFSNYGNGIMQIPAGIHGLSNHLLDTPWPKVRRGVPKMQALLETEELATQPFFDLLYDDGIAPDDQLPDTGVGIERERMLSSMFIKTPNYGSRCSTVLLIDRQNKVTYAERVFNLTTFDYSEKKLEFEYPTVY
ncbi:MAG: NRDE family protein [Bacteroidia bacterium]|nr:NRDE family protein [Bacteroidia bacterium]